MTPADQRKMEKITHRIEREFGDHNQCAYLVMVKRTDSYDMNFASNLDPESIIKVLEAALETAKLNNTFETAYAKEFGHG